MRDNNKRAWENLPESPQTQGVTGDPDPGTDKSRPATKVTMAEVETNKQFGWFVEDGVVKQVVTISPREVRVVGRLAPHQDGQSEPADSLEQEIRTITSDLFVASRSKRKAMDVLPGYTVKMLALIRRREREAVEAFAEAVKNRLHGLPRHGPTNTSLWDGVQMDTAIAAIDAELAKWKEGEKE